MKKFLILTILFLVSCTANQDLEEVSLDQFEEDMMELNVESVVFKDDQMIIEVETYDGREYKVKFPNEFSKYEGIKNWVVGLEFINISYASVAANKPSIWSQLLIGSLPLLGIIMFICLFLAVWAAYLASNRNQSKALWFFLTLIFPIAILFIATKDRVKKN